MSQKIVLLDFVSNKTKLFLIVQQSIFQKLAQQLLAQSG